MHCIAQTFQSQVFRAKKKISRHFDRINPTDYFCLPDFLPLRRLLKYCCCPVPLRYCYCQVPLKYCCCPVPLKYCCCQVPLKYCYCPVPLTSSTVPSVSTNTALMPLVAPISPFASSLPIQKQTVDNASPSKELSEIIVTDSISLFTG